MAGGSDAPIESACPFTGMHDAMMRSNVRRVQDTSLTRVYRPTECLSFDEALSIYTRGGAYAGDCDNQLGSIATGFLADLVVCDLQCIQEPWRLHALKPAMSMVGGQVVHWDEDQGMHEAHFPL